MLEGTGNVDLKAMEAQTANLSQKAAKTPGFLGLFSSFRATTPQLYVDVDRVKCKTMKVDLNDVFDTLQVFLGGYYVNDFNRFGRTWQVNIQADAPFRVDAEIVKQFKVRNANGDMVPLGSVATVRSDVGLVFLLRYNMYTAVAINGATLPSVSSGSVIDTMEKLSDRELPRNMTYEWSELSYMEKETSRLALHFAIFSRIHPWRSSERWCWCSWSWRRIRKLVAAVVGDPGRADVFVMCLDGHIPGGDGFEYLCTGGLRGPCRPGEQKRDPYCRIRSRPAERWSNAVQSNRGGCPGAVAADPHDLVCVHSGCRATGSCKRRRVGNATDSRNGCVQWHAGRDPVRHFLDARVLLRGPQPDRTTACSACVSANGNEANPAGVSFD